MVYTTIAENETAKVTTSYENGKVFFQLWKFTGVFFNGLRVACKQFEVVCGSFSEKEINGEWHKLNAQVIA